MNDNDNITNIFRGTVARKVFRVVNRYSQYNIYFDKPYIQGYKEFIKHDIFYKCETEKPPFEVGEKVYINDLDLTVTIEEAIRSTNGEYVYNTDYYFDFIEDEITERTRIEAEKILEEELVKYNEHLSGELKKNKKWYQFWK